MKIAFFADNFYPELSGIADTILVTGKELARRGHQIDYFVPFYPKKSYDLVGVEYKNPELLPRMAIRRLFSFPVKTPTGQGRGVLPNIFRGIFLRSNFDIIHSHSFFGPGLDALCLSKIKNIPLVGTNHTVIKAFIDYFPIKGPRFRNFVERYVIWYYNHCDFMSAPSEFLLEEMKSNGFKAPGRAVSNPVEEGFFRPLAEKSALKRKFGFQQFTVLYAGRISEEKNLGVLMEAFIRFAKKNAGANLVLLGQGATRAKLEKEAEKSGVGDRIKITGPFLGENKNKLYEIFRAADVFAMPSTSETQSMGAIQAMAAGLPVIVAKAGALPALMASGGGVDFKPDDAGELEACLEKLQNQPALREELGRNAYNFASRFSPGKIADAWEKIYYETIKNRRGRKS